MLRVPPVVAPFFFRCWLAFIGSNRVFFFSFYRLLFRLDYFCVCAVLFLLAEDVNLPRENLWRRGQRRRDTQRPPVAGSWEGKAFYRVFFWAFTGFFFEAVRLHRLFIDLDRVLPSFSLIFFRLAFVYWSQGRWQREDVFTEFFYWVFFWSRSPGWHWLFNDRVFHSFSVLPSLTFCL